MDMTSGASTMAMAPASSGMDMVFSTAHDTPLYGAAWRPSSDAAYAATCLFLVLLAVAFRSGLAWKTALARRWRVRSDAWDAALRGSGGVGPYAKGEGEGAVVGRRRVPFRLSVDVPRAMVVTVLLGMGYLLMLAVMTMNVGYFLSVLAGGFVGELLFGRWAEQVTVVEAHMC